jgi:hypothetical protein
MSDPPRRGRKVGSMFRHPHPIPGPVTHVGTMSPGAQERENRGWNMPQVGMTGSEGPPDRVGCWLSDLWPEFGSPGEFDASIGLPPPHVLWLST